jgi:phosphatidate cytidylyltransferase
MFCVAVPLVVCIVVFLPQYHHLAVNISVIALSSLGAMEFAGLLKKIGAKIPLAEAAILGIAAPIGATLIVSFDVSVQVAPSIFTLSASWVIISRIFSNREKLKDVFGYVAAGLSTIFYPGFFLSWVIQMTQWDNATQIIITFFLIVIANDSAAWAFGMLFGKNNRGVIAASPNKSVAGYVGGLLASVLISFITITLLPNVFIPKRIILSRLVASILLGLFVGVAASLGDLSESALKRSVNTKDSGNIILGRGGVMDSIDSIALAAPVFYAAYCFLFI